nr:cupin domain-containing protein [Streptomyces sp. NTH33]
MLDLVEVRGQPVEFEPQAGDYALRVGGADFAVDDVVLGGHVDLNPAGAALLAQALPPVAHIRASDAPAAALRTCVDRLVEEVTGGRMGAAFAVRQHAQLLLLEVLRAYLGQAELPPGWLRALTDDRLRPALNLMHAEPGRPWGLEELARATAMSLRPWRESGATAGRRGRSSRRSRRPSEQDAAAGPVAEDMAGLFDVAGEPVELRPGEHRPVPDGREGLVEAVPVAAGGAGEAAVDVDAILWDAERERCLIRVP